jgi:hypothetical protein
MTDSRPVNPYHRIWLRPVPFIIDVKSLEQFFVSPEKFFHCVYQQRFPEAARTGQEINPPIRNDSMDIRRFVNVQITFIP